MYVPYCCDVRRSRISDAIQVMDEAKDSVPTLQLLKHEILTGSVHQCLRTCHCVPLTDIVTAL